MGTIINGNKWSGACVNGNVVSGLVKNGAVFYKKNQQGYFLIEYTDISDIKSESKYSDFSLLNNFTKNNSNIKICKISNFNLTVVDYNLASMFSNCYNLEAIDLNNFDTSNITSLAWTFSGCYKLNNVNLSGFNTSNVTIMYNMFQSCRSLTDLDLSNFNTKKVTNMEGMFNGCNKLKNLDISGFDFDSVKNSNRMFDGIPRDCLIKVKDQASKDFVLGVRSNLTNVVIA